MNGRTAIPALAATASIILCSLLGCSVKEDRDGCPSVLRLLLGSARTLGDSLGVQRMYLALDAADFRYRGNIPQDAEEYRIAVPREAFDVEVFMLEEELDAEDYLGQGGFFGKNGQQFPALWRFGCGVEIRGESAVADVRLHKEFCRVKVVVLEEGQSSIPLEINFISRVNGILTGGGCSESPLSFPAGRISEGETSVRIPRQKDGSLLMEVCSDESVSRSFPLGRYLIDCGYDWNAENLEDIEIVIDCSLTRLTLYRKGWDKTFSFVAEI
ncbi:MAG: hypothetical protein ACI4AE_07075 [Candidatus Cryptobacteroides sp.]